MLKKLELVYEDSLPESRLRQIEVRAWGIKVMIEHPIAKFLQS